MRLRDETPLTPEAAEELAAWRRRWQASPWRPSSRIWRRSH